MKAQPFKYLWGAIFLIAIIFLQWIPRSDFWELTGIYLTAFVAYVILMINHRRDGLLLFVMSAVGVASFFFSEPLLSEDIYRFLWDGKMSILGISPYEFTPSEYAGNNHYLNEAYLKMTDLTKENYSCYPPFNQLYFYLAAAVDSVQGSILLMRTLVLLTIVPGFIFLDRLLKENNLDRTLIWLVILNPLFLIETFGNLHFEAVMLSFLIVSFYYLKRNILISAILFTLAVQVKLLPLIVIPFLVRFIGLKKTIIFGLTSLVLLVAITFPFMNYEQFMHFAESLRLYFGIFEFNSFIPHYINEIIGILTGFNPIRYTSPVLSLITLILVLFISFSREKRSLTDFIEEISYALLVYLLLNSTIHPWYLIILIFLFPFARMNSIIIWTLLIIFSYSFYSMDTETSRWLINLEYLLLFVSIFFEFRRNRRISADDHVF